MTGNINEEAGVVSQMLPPAVVAKRLHELCGDETELSRLYANYIQYQGLALLVYLIYLGDPDTPVKEAISGFLARYRGRYYGMVRAREAATIDAKYRQIGLSSVRRKLVTPKEQEAFRREAATNYDIVRAEGMCYLFREPEVSTLPTK